MCCVAESRTLSATSHNQHIQCARVLVADWAQPSVRIPRFPGFHDGHSLRRRPPPPPPPGQVAPHMVAACGHQRDA